MELAQTIISTLTAVKDAEKRAAMLRRLVLNEAYFNLAIVDVIGTKAVAASSADRDRLIARLRTDTRCAHGLFSVEKGAFARIKAFLGGMVGGAEEPEVEDFAGWSDSEVYHYALNKIDVLKAIVEAKLDCQEKLQLGRRLAGIRRALLALVDKLRV